MVMFVVLWERFNFSEMGSNFYGLCYHGLSLVGDFLLVPIFVDWLNSGTHDDAMSSQQSLLGQ